jgi:hypothetical protein
MRPCPSSTTTPLWHRCFGEQIYPDPLQATVCAGWVPPGFRPLKNGLPWILIGGDWGPQETVVPPPLQPPDSAGGGGLTPPKGELGFCHQNEPPPSGRDPGWLNGPRLLSATGVLLTGLTNPGWYCSPSTSKLAMSGGRVVVVVVRCFLFLWGKGP